MIATNNRNRSRQNRRRTIAGPSEAFEDKNAFSTLGDFEREAKANVKIISDGEETNSLANTSIYEHLNEPDDVESFHNFYNKKRQEREIEKSEEKPRGTP